MEREYTLGLYEKSMPSDLSWEQKSSQRKQQDLIILKSVLMRQMQSSQDLICQKKNAWNWSG